MTRALDQLAQRVATDPLFFAVTVARYQERHGITDDDLTRMLGVETLTPLRLCLAAKSVAHLAEIAEHCGVANLEALGAVWTGGQ